VVDRLTLGETLRDVVEGGMVGVELGRVMPDPLLAGIAERLVISAVGPEDDAIGGDPM
jgi:hypothetical protein